MSSLLRIAAFVAGLAVSGSLLAADIADMVLVNGKVVTVDDRFSIAQALAVKGERIAAVGSNAEVAKLAGESTRRIDLQGRTAVLHTGLGGPGRMIGGRKVLRQTLTREEALIAHTRNNAHFLFQEANLGSLQPGKYADLLVLDRDYLTVPEDLIEHISPVMTMVGGKIVYEAGKDAR